MFESRISAGATEKLPRNVWNDIVSWQTGRLNNSTKHQLHALMTIISMKKNWNPWEKCRKYAFKLFWNAYIWNVLEDLIFHGQWTNLHDRSHNGPKIVTNVYAVWSLTFIMHVNTNSIAMWETLPNNADWDCFKTPILQEMLKIQNMHQVEHCAFLEVIHLSHSVGCVRNKLQFRTVQQNQKSFHWMPDRGWMVSPHLVFWDLIVAVLHGNTCQSIQERRDLCTNLVRAAPHTIQKRKQSHRVINDLDNVDFIPSNVNSSHQEALLYIFEDNEAVINMIIKGRNPTMRHVSRTHRVALDWLFDRVNLDPKIQVKYKDTKTNSQTC